MRAIVVHTLAVLLIVIFAIEMPQPATADCMQCHDCETSSPAKNDIPCPEKGMVCQVAQACASQVQKSPAQINVDQLAGACRARFSFDIPLAFTSAYLTPETAPPRA